MGFSVRLKLETDKKVGKFHSEAHIRSFVYYKQQLAACVFPSFGGETIPSDWLVGGRAGRRQLLLL